MRFKDKVVVVTGAAQGIGEAYAKALAAEGAAVVVADLNAESGERVAKEIEADGGVALFVSCDVSNAESAAALVARTVEEYGGIDHLVNNAAIYGAMEFNLLISVDWDYYKKFMSVNLDGALVMTRAVYPEIAKRGGGAIVNQSSTAAYLYSGFYGLAKAGINSLTQQLAHELGGQGIRVNAIAPGPVDDGGDPDPGGRGGPGHRPQLARDQADGRDLRSWSAAACSCSPTRRRGSPARSWRSTAARRSGSDDAAGGVRRARQHRQADGAAAGCGGGVG